MAIVIIGAGIIGTSTAYYLSQEKSISPSTIHLVESSPELFASASGYAGGFLARDWFSPAVASLGSLSFDLHKQLAEDNQGAEKWGYSDTTTFSLAQVRGQRGDEWLREGTSRVEAAAVHDSVTTSGPLWLKRERLRDLENISSGDSTAQVNPLALCKFLMAQCQSRGVQLHHPATPIALSTDEAGTPTAIVLKTASAMVDLPCKRLIIAAGAWTPRVCSTLFPKRVPRIPISSLAGHSLVLRSPSWRAGGQGEKESCHAIYTSEDGYSPEIFARLGGEIYIAGVNDAGIVLPEYPTERKIDAASIAKLRATARRLLQVDAREILPKSTAEDDGLEIIREGLCWRPITNKGTPFISPVYDLATKKAEQDYGPNGGVWIAAGHGPWGISLSLGTGKVVSEMLQGKETSADISRLKL